MPVWPDLFCIDASDTRPMWLGACCTQSWKNEARRNCFTSPPCKHQFSMIAPRAVVCSIYFSLMISHFAHCQTCLTCSTWKITVILLSLRRSLTHEPYASIRHFHVTEVQNSPTVRGKRHKSMDQERPEHASDLECFRGSTDGQPQLHSDTGQTFKGEATSLNLCPPALWHLQRCWS